MPEIRLVLGSEDLSRVRFAFSADPIDEMIFAAHRMPLLSADPVFGGWVRRTASALGPAGASILRFMDSGFVQVSDLTRAQPFGGESFEDGLESILCAPRMKWRSEVDNLASMGVPVGPAVGLAEGRVEAINQFGRALQAFHRAAIAPYWSRVTTQATARRNALAEKLAREGTEHLLRTLHPEVTWHAPVLAVNLGAGCPPGCIHDQLLNSMTPTTRTFMGGGRGLVLNPTVFGEGPSLTVPDPGEDEPFVLFLPAPPDWSAFIAPTEHSGVTDPLADLMGGTRASVMEALADHELTTSTLAKLLRISTASASEHATVLRAAQLVASTRQGNRVVHRLTALGDALIQTTQST